MHIRDINPLGASTRTWLLVDDATRGALMVDPVDRHIPHYLDYLGREGVVRSVSEYHDDGLGSIPGALLVPLDHLEAEADNLRALGTPIVLSCRSTVRSVLGASVLERMGLPSVSVLEGGILAWASEGHPVELTP